MNEDDILQDDGTSPEGTSILEREAKIRGDSQPEPTTRIVEKGRQAEEENEEEEEDEDEIAGNPQTSNQPGPTLADPGDFVPGDYTFEVTVFDQNNQNGRTRKIKSVDDWDELLEGDPNLGSAAALLKAQRNATKMETGLDRDQREHDAKKVAFDAEKANLDQRQQVTDTMVSEIGYLQSKGDLPEVAKKYVDADWSDPEIAKQPGVKEQLRLLNYMRDENKRRTTAKLKPMTSILDAFNAYQLDRARKGQTTARSNAATARKAAGARVSGVSSAPAGAAPAGVAVGRGGSLRDLGRQAL